MPHVLELMLSDGVKKLKNQLHDIKIGLFPWLNEITFYHRLDDPYSYLLLQQLMLLDQQPPLKINIELLFDLPAELNPEPEKLKNYALKDCNRLIKYYKLDMQILDKQPSRRETFEATACLLNQKISGNKPGDKEYFMYLVSELTSALWGHGTTTLESCLKRYGSLSETEAKAFLDKSVEALLANGHYMSAMLYYGGEWYWGIDRFEYLKQRLSISTQNKLASQFSSFEDNYLSLTLKLPTQKNIIDFYFSFRSPYSYLAAEVLFKMASQHQFDINIKPVLPMVMRGFKIPKIKRLYIVKDVKREANRLGLPFGKICDPIGAGVERCLALLPYANSEAKERAFISSICRGIWAEGADVCNDEILAKLLSRAGLDWQPAKSWLNRIEWKKDVEKNSKDLSRLGLWGVPAFACEDDAVWGQDRLWVVENAVKERN